MKPRLAAVLLFLPLLGLATPPLSAWPAEDAADAIEKELRTLLREMDALSTELDRIGETAAVPKATSLRIEIRRSGGIAAPASAKLLLSGKAAAEREFSREEKDAFVSEGGVIVWNVPVLPGSYEARLVLSHPFSRQTPSFDFHPSPKSGETFLLRLTLGFADGTPGRVIVAPSVK
ncbi:MAG: hypothetical protein OHK0028_19470 [Deltaproteobacteria bacterium]